MNGPTPPRSQAGGAILAISIILGAFIGAVLGQPTIGFLSGTAIGVAVAILIWQRDRRR